MWMFGTLVLSCDWFSSEGISSSSSGSGALGGRGGTLGVVVMVALLTGEFEKEWA